LAFGDNDAPSPAAAGELPSLLHGVIFFSVRLLDDRATVFFAGSVCCPASSVDTHNSQTVCSQVRSYYHPWLNAEVQSAKCSSQK